MNMKKTFILLFTLLSINIVMIGCSKKQTDPISKSDFALDTVITITIYDSDDETLIDNCFSLCDKYENLFSRTLETSEVTQINSSLGSPVSISDETAELLKKGLEYSTLSEGAFDITIGSVTELWDFKSESPEIPLRESIEKALSSISYENVGISGNTVTLKNPDSKIDLGGIAKGYIADQLKEYLKSEGVKHAIISLGGNVLAIGGRTDGSDYVIGIQKPFDEQNATIAAVKISDKSVVSSGIYERYFEKDGKIYHHILNPKTGYPYENNLYEVTIISDYSVDGDALSTTCFSLGLEKGMELVESLDNIEAIFVTDDYTLHYSSGIGDKISLVE